MKRVSLACCCIKETMGKTSKAGAPVEEPKRERPADNGEGWKGHMHHKEMRKFENTAFTRYYRDTQRITQSDAEWEEFMTMLRTPLPTTLWINDTDPMAPSIRAYFESLPTIMSPIPWYPFEGMAWRINVDKTTFRKDPAVQPLRKFMINQTAMGTISRQEEVSMIPPLLLDIQPSDKCLDMCASPGSKTAQMLVELGRKKMVPFESNASPFPVDYLSEGCVMANELDTKRANMLVHQVKRLRLLFPFAFFTNHDARYFPELMESETEKIRFDKVLCDVVCSGDGTIRKAPFIFKVWSTREAMSLQKKQIQIALRGAHLTKVGGRLVYSTCSLNPLENEAVVAQIAVRTKGAMRLVDARHLLPDLPCQPGLTTWKVTGKKGEIVSAPSAEHFEALFPPKEIPADLDLTKCMRLMPHHCNGGAFFVAVFDKIAEFSLDSAATESSEEPLSEQKRERASSDEAGSEGSDKLRKLSPQFVGIPTDLAKNLSTFYELSDFPVDNLVVRTAPGEKELVLSNSTTISLVSNTVRSILRGKSPRLIVVSAGLRVFAAENLNKGWRISNEAACLFTKFMKTSSRVIHVTLDDILPMLSLEANALKDIAIPDIVNDVLREKIESLSLGTVLMLVKIDSAPAGFIATVALRARSRLQLLVDNEDIVALRLRLGLAAEAVEAGGAEDGNDE